MWPNPQFPEDLATFTEKIPNGNLIFCAVIWVGKSKGLWSYYSWQIQLSKSLLEKAKSATWKYKKKPSKWILFLLIYVIYSFYYLNVNIK